MDTNTITLTLPYIITIGISSGLFAGLVSTIGNMIIAFCNQKNESKIETLKYRNSINDYRYKELHKYLKNLCDLPGKNYAAMSTDEMKKLVENSNIEDEKVMSVFRRGYTLLDKELQEPLIVARNAVDNISNALVEQVFANKEDEYDVGDLISARDTFRNKLIEAFQNQLATLLVYDRVKK